MVLNAKHNMLYYLVKWRITNVDNLRWRQKRRHHQRPCCDRERPRPCTQLCCRRLMLLFVLYLSWRHTSVVDHSGLAAFARLLSCGRKRRINVYLAIYINSSRNEIWQSCFLAGERRRCEGAGAPDRRRLPAPRPSVRPSL